MVIQLFRAPIIRNTSNHVHGHVAESPRNPPSSQSQDSVRSTQYSGRTTPCLCLMSHFPSTASSSSNFQLIINNALKAYEKRTKEDLLAHPLAAQLQACNSPGDILAILQQQIQLDQSRNSDDRWSKWLNPTVSVLYSLSDTLGEGASLVSLRTPICLRLHSHIFAGILTWESYICRCWCSSLSAHPSSYFCAADITLKSHRQLRTFRETKIYSLVFWSTWKGFFDVSRSTHKYQRPRKC